MKICDNYSITQFLQDNLSLVFPFWFNYEPSCQKVGTQMYARLWQGPPPLDLAIIARGCDSSRLGPACYLKIMDGQIQSCGVRMVQNFIG